MDDLEQIDFGLSFETVSNPADTHKSWISKRLHQIEDVFQDATMASEMRIKRETMAKDTKQWLRDVGTDFFQAFVIGNVASQSQEELSGADYYIVALGLKNAIQGIFGPVRPAEIPRNRRVLPKMPPVGRVPR